MIAYCLIGERSAHTWFVLHELLGYPSVENCDGSWTEYGSLVGVPVERLTSAGSVAVLRTEDLPHRSQAALTTAYRSITAQMPGRNGPHYPTLSVRFGCTRVKQRDHRFGALDVSAVPPVRSRLGHAARR